MTKKVPKVEVAYAPGKSLDLLSVYWHEGTLYIDVLLPKKERKVYCSCYIDHYCKKHRNKKRKK